MDKLTNKKLIFFESEILKINSTYKLYCGLFTDDEVIKSMNRISPFSFNNIKASLEISLLLLICKLSDPPIQKNHKNLSIKSLLSIAKDQNWSKAKADHLNKLIYDFDEIVSPMKNIRNKQGAHIDYNVALEIEKPDDIFLNQFSQAINVLNKILDLFIIKRNYLYPDDHRLLTSFLKNNGFDR